MKRIGLLLGFLAVVVFALPSLTAQNAKKDAAKAEKKTDENKDPEKKDPEKKDDEKKDPEKKDDEKKKAEPKKAAEKLVYGNKFYTKILSANAASNRELTVETKEVDPKKVAEVATWSYQQQQSLAKQLYNASTQKDANARYQGMMNYQKAQYTYQVDYAKKQQNIYLTKPYEVRAAENVKVRSLNPPVEFDDTGFQKKWTKKELEERKDKTGLPGFPVDLDALKSGQYVEIYMAKVTPPAKGAKKKNPDDEVVIMERPEYVMIVILQEAK